jgi:hypothetical protein
VGGYHHSTCVVGFWFLPLGELGYSILFSNLANRKGEELKKPPSMRVDKIRP